MAKKNLPHIPVYIGDWEKDCNILSLQTEGAWLRIIFKMFTNGKKSSYKIPTKGLQNLWRVSETEAQEIVTELQDYNICDINIDGRFIEFISRRYKRENEVSEIRKKAVSKRSDRTKPLQTSNKISTNTIQNADNDNDNDNDIVIEDNIENEKKEIADFEIFEKEFCDLISEYFLQTSEVQKMRVTGFVKSKRIRDQIENFKIQTKAYAQYKELTGEKIHSWSSYQTEWDREDWIKKLERERNSKTKQEKKDLPKKEKRNAGELILEQYGINKAG